MRQFAMVVGVAQNWCGVDGMKLLRKKVNAWSRVLLPTDVFCIRQLEYYSGHIQKCQTKAQ